MGQTPLTPKVLRDKEFEERMMYGHVFYVKGKYAVTYSFAWIPCNFESGTPLATNVYVNTWEELEKLMEEPK